MQISTFKIWFNQVDDRSIKEIKLPTIWKHVLNDNSKAVETLLAKMAEIANISRPNATLIKFLLTHSLDCKYYSREKN